MWLRVVGDAASESGSNSRRLWLRVAGAAASASDSDGRRLWLRFADSADAASANGTRRLWLRLAGSADAASGSDCRFLWLRLAASGGGSRFLWLRLAAPGSDARFLWLRLAGSADVASGNDTRRLWLRFSGAADAASPDDGRRLWLRDADNVWGVRSRRPKPSGSPAASGVDEDRPRRPAGDESTTAAVAAGAPYRAGCGEPRRFLDVDAGKGEARFLATPAAAGAGNGRGCLRGRPTPRRAGVAAPAVAAAACAGEAGRGCFRGRPGLRLGGAAPAGARQEWLHNGRGGTECSRRLRLGNSRRHRVEVPARRGGGNRCRHTGKDHLVHL